MPQIARSTPAGTPYWLSILSNSAAFDFFKERPLEMIEAAPRRLMKSSTEPLNALWTARSALMVAVA
jgi:hypothetical protein